MLHCQVAVQANYTHVCDAGASNGQRHRRWNTLADLKAEQNPMCTNPYMMEKKLTTNNRIFFHASEQSKNAFHKEL